MLFVLKTNYRRKRVENTDVVLFARPLKVTLGIVSLFYLLILWSLRAKEAALNGGRSENSQVFKPEVRNIKLLAAKVWNSCTSCEADTLWTNL